MSPFKALLSFYPQIEDVVQKQARDGLNVPAAKETVEKLLDMRRALQVKLEQVYRN